MKRAAILLGLLVPLAAVADVVVPAARVQDSVNIRLDPDTNSDVVGKLEKGSSLPHVDSVDGWHEVQLEGDATGFVSADWSTVEPDPASVSEVVEATVERTLEATAEVTAEATAEATDAATAEAEVVQEAPSEPEPEVAPEPQPVPEIEPVVEAEFAGPEAATAPPPSPGFPSLEVKADRDYIVRLRKEGVLGNSQLFDDGNRVGIGTNAPQQRLEVNGSISIHDQNSNVAGLMITQASGETGYIMHNRASTLTIGAGSIDRITIDRDGNVGFGASRPAHPLEMASGAHVTAGGVWTNRSSRESKENIAGLNDADALAAVMALEPVTFTYKAEQGEDYLGFVAEDVPALLASSDGQSLSAMDVVAALTKVVQEQQLRIEALEAKLAER
ncbi:MAG: tail fiber domain-containing protein [Woeseiaceae bacterium]|nr:tail fiber domain-containing protein [Woeseiaceae bacterium]